MSRKSIQKDAKLPFPAADKSVDPNNKNYLTPAEMKLFLASSKKSRHAVRDYCMSLVTYRHGLRVSELIDTRLNDLDMGTARIYVRRVKGSLSTHQPIEGDEIRAIRMWLREREHFPAANSGYLFLSERGPMTRQAVNYLISETGIRANLSFKVHPHMLRHSTGYYLANKGYDTRLIQDYLGHKNITHTVKYTRTAAHRFENLWR